MQKRVLFFSVAMLFAASACWAQTQTCRSSIAATTGHLVGKTDGTVLDSKNKLMWKRCPEGYSYDSSDNICLKITGVSFEYSWTNAFARPLAVNTSKFAGYDNWRLPNIKELHSIVEEKCLNPAVNLTAFPMTSDGNVIPDGNVMWIWSNSPSVKIGSSWYIDLVYGDMAESARSELRGVRLVRDCVGTECD